MLSIKVGYSLSGQPVWSLSEHRVHWIFHRALGTWGPHRHLLLSLIAGRATCRNSSSAVTCTASNTAHRVHQFLGAIRAHWRVQHTRKYPPHHSIISFSPSSQGKLPVGIEGLQLPLQPQRLLSGYISGWNKGSLEGSTYPKIPQHRNFTSFSTSFQGKLFAGILGLLLPILPQRVFTGYNTEWNKGTLEGSTYPKIPPSLQHHVWVEKGVHWRVQRTRKYLRPQSSQHHLFLYLITRKTTCRNIRSAVTCTTSNTAHRVHFWMEQGHTRGFNLPENTPINATSPLGILGLLLNVLLNVVDLQAHYHGL